MGRRAAQFAPVEPPPAASTPDDLAADGSVPYPRAARWLGVGLTFVREEVAAGRLLCVRLGTKPVIPLASLRHYLAERIRESMERTAANHKGRSRP